MSESLTDNELISKAIAGDSDAFDTLLQRYYTTIQAFAFRISRGTDAEDITQEALIKIARAIRSYRGESKFTTWCYKIVVNVARDFARSRARKERIVTKASGEVIDALQSHKESSLSKEVREALVSLEDGERECLVLAIYEGLSHKEIGAIVGCAEATVSWRIFKAKKKLKKLLSDDEQTSQAEEPSV